MVATMFSKWVGDAVSKASMYPLYLSSSSLKLFSCEAHMCTMQLRGAHPAQRLSVLGFLGSERYHRGATYHEERRFGYCCAARQHGRLSMYALLLYSIDYTVELMLLLVCHCRELCKTPFQGFPVVTSRQDNVVVGFVSRRELLELLGASCCTCAGRLFALTICFALLCFHRREAPGPACDG